RARGDPRRIGARRRQPRRRVMLLHTESLRAQTLRADGAGDGHAPDVILAIDQGTTGTTSLVVDEELRVLGRGYREIRQYFPKAGWVEHDPDEIWESVLVTAEEALARAGIRPTGLEAIGITNQRETTLVWDKRSGRSVYPAIVWQDRRT